MSWRPDCMDADELALWQAANRTLGTPDARPCADCPVTFRSRMLAESRCNRPPLGRPRTAHHSEDRRRMWAEKSRAYRERKRQERAA